ncbi:MAG: hypothetical protein IJ512_02495 [Ruminococcus sp.]|nr:hypothetical protein [Ruminococcus sp.]
MATEAELNEKIEHLEGMVAKKKEELEEQKKKVESLEKEIKGLNGTISAMQKRMFWALIWALVCIFFFFQKFGHLL